MHAWPLACLALVVIAVPDTAHAFAEPSLFGQPVNVPPPLSDADVARLKASFEQHLADNDLVFVGDRIMPKALLGGGPGPQHDHDGTWHDEPHYATIFLNFFGGQLTSGTNAAEMQSGCVGGMTVDYPAYNGTEADALAIIQVFENAMAPYAVRVAYEEAPPQHLPYSMVMMGGTPAVIGQPGSTLGVSCSTDCGDVWWRDTTLAFTEQSGNPTTLGNTALQEAAHAFGLDHIDGSGHIMYPVATLGNKSWSSECTPYNDSTGPIGCEYVHEAFCPEGSQSDDAELLAFFGPNAPDTQAPEAVIMEPAPDTMVATGGSVAVTAEVTDDHLGFGWRLRVVPPGGEELIQNAYQFETSWNLSFAGQPDGAYEIWIEAVDHDGNAGSAMVTVYVGDEPPPPGSDESGSGGVADTGSGDGDASAEAGGSDDDATSDTMPLGDDGGGDKACECRAGDRDTPAGWLAMPLLIAALRRRAMRARSR